MGLTAAIIGGISGTGLHMFANATRKVPLSRQPWGHVGYFILGMWAGNAYVRLERELVEDINEIRADKGMPPLVGSSGWIKYSTPERTSKGITTN